MARHRVRVELGSIPIDLELDGERCAPLLRHYAGFELEERTSAAWLVCCEHSETPAGMEPQLPRLMASGDSSYTLDDSATYHTRIDPATRRVEIEYRTWEGPETLGPEPRGLHSALKAGLGVMLALDGGFLLHAAGALCGQGALAFLGQSGAGKSTISRAIPASRLLNDEIIAVRLDRGLPLLCSTPFCGELERPLSRQSAPWTGGVFLHKSTNDALATCSPAEALRGLAQCIVLAEGCDDIEKTTFERAARVIDAVAWTHLHFRRRANDAVVLVFGHYDKDMRPS